MTESFLLILLLLAFLLVISYLGSILKRYLEYKRNRMKIKEERTLIIEEELSSEKEEEKNNHP